MKHFASSSRIGWNGNLALADHIVAGDYKLHMTPIDGSDLSRFAGPQGLASWVGQIHSMFTPLAFAIQVPPLFGEDTLAVRWLTTGTYTGGMPGAHAPAGTVVSFAGADFLRVQDGKIVEYWLSSDMLDMMGQLGMLGS